MPRVKLFDEKIVLEKAMNLFWKQGYAATSVQDLVNHLGINRASLYDTFGDKEKLFFKAFELYRKENTSQVQAFLDKEPVVKTGLKKLFDKAIQSSIEDEEKKGCFVVNTTTEMIPGDEKITGILKENTTSFEKVFYAYLLKGESLGQIKPGKDLKAIASLLFTLYNGLKVVSKVQTDLDHLMRSVEVAISLLD